MSKTYRIACIPGDGIGEEITAAAVKVMTRAAQNAGLQLECQWHPAGGAAIDACARESVRNIHHYDVKRADRCMARWGLEGRVPLLDPEFFESDWVIPGEERHPRERGLEKWWLREAFAGTGLLPVN